MPSLTQNNLQSTTYLLPGFPGGSEVKNPPANAADVGLIPGLRRSPGEGNGNPLQSLILILFSFFLFSSFISTVLSSTSLILSSA